MNKCNSYIGFFNLSQCKNTSHFTCQLCKKSYCGKHLFKDRNLCVECAAMDQDTKILNDDDLANNNNPYANRDYFYQKVDRYLSTRNNNINVSLFISGISRDSILSSTSFSDTHDSVEFDQDDLDSFDNNDSGDFDSDGSDVFDS